MQDVSTPVNDPYLKLLEDLLTFSARRRVEEVHITKAAQLEIVASAVFRAEYHPTINNMLDRAFGRKLIIHKSADQSFWFEPNEIAVQFEDF